MSIKMESSLNDGCNSPSMTSCVPFISRIQKLTLYESPEVFYLLGSDEAETKFRMLEISRSDPRELAIYDDKIIYSVEGIRNRISHLKGRDKGRLRLPFSRANLSKVVSGFGFVGFVRFLEGYYIILITARKKVAIIGGHTLFKIEETRMLYIPNDVTRVAHPDEQRYLKLFQNVDLSSNFYFSYSYDVTRTLQYNCALASVPGMPAFDPCCCTQPATSQPLPAKGAKALVVRGEALRKFTWNAYLLKDVESCVQSDWILHVTHGFVGQTSMSIFGKPIYLTLIARRSNRFAGTRFFKRGSNNFGDVANDVETEQIIFDGSVTQFKDGNYTSFTQHRGSVPVLWSQDPTKLMPKPPISVDQNDAFGAVGGLHFRQMFKQYGSPIIILNLVKRKEKKRHEGILCSEYTSLLDYLNQFLPTAHRIRYIAFDMARANKNKGSDVLLSLDDISEKCLKKTGFYASKCSGLTATRRQTGTVRTNCVDCLDRTNTAQFALGKSALGHQLAALGVIAEPKLQFDTDCVRMLEDLYEDLGDTVALQYGGSNLVHRIQTYRKTAPLTSHSNDILQTLSRYYSNAFSDAEKQQSLNVFLGVYVPRATATPLWDLQTDLYLHSTEHKQDRAYCEWLSLDMRLALPLPHEEVTKMVRVVDTCDCEDYPDILSEYYKTKEMTAFHELLTFYMPNSIRDFMPKGVPLAQSSPFSVRKVPQWRHVFPTSAAAMSAPTAFNINATFNASTNYTSLSFPSRARSPGSQVDNESAFLNLTASSSDMESLATGEEVNFECTLSDNESVSSHTRDDGGCAGNSARSSPCTLTFQSVFESPSAVYGVDLLGHPTSSQIKIYKHYVRIGAETDTNLMAKSFYPFGSEEAVEPPTVKKEAKHLYQVCVDVGLHGAKSISDKNRKMYENYVAQLYQ